MNATCANSSVSSEYLIRYGLTHELGRFTGSPGLRRGDRVVIPTPHGEQLGEILRPSSARLGSFLGEATPGVILRPATPQDEHQAHLHALQAAALRNALPGILEAEFTLDGRSLLVQIAGPRPDEIHYTLTQQAARQGLEVVVYLAGSAELPDAEHSPSGGCGSCDSEGGCGSCGTTGGCGTGCGGEVADVRAYFASLRTQMEQTRRTSLL
jgi:hypothetical protein